MTCKSLRCTCMPVVAILLSLVVPAGANITTTTPAPTTLAPSPPANACVEGPEKIRDKSTGTLAPTCDNDGGTACCCDRDESCTDGSAVWCCPTSSQPGQSPETVERRSSTGDSILCPGKDEGDYCDCSGDCRSNPRYDLRGAGGPRCGCNAAQKCCAQATNDCSTQADCTAKTNCMDQRVYTVMCVDGFCYRSS